MKTSATALLLALLLSTHAAYAADGEHSRDPFEPPCGDNCANSDGGHGTDTEEADPSIGLPNHLWPTVTSLHPEDYDSTSFNPELAQLGEFYAQDVLVRVSASAGRNRDSYIGIAKEGDTYRIFTLRPSENLWFVPNYPPHSEFIARGELPPYL